MLVRPTQIHLPYKGAPSTVAAIRHGALASQSNYVLRQLVEDVCQELRSKDYVSEALAWLRFVESRTRYMRDPRTREMVRAPYLLAQEIAAGHRPSADCDCLVALLTAGTLMSGAESVVVTYAFHHMVYAGERQYSHVAAGVIEPRSGALIVLDPVAGKSTKSMLNRAVAAKIWPIA